MELLGLASSLEDAPFAAPPVDVQPMMVRSLLDLLLSGKEKPIRSESQFRPTKLEDTAKLLIGTAKQNPRPSVGDEEEN